MTNLARKIRSSMTATSALHVKSSLTYPPLFYCDSDKMNMNLLALEDTCHSHQTRFYNANYSSQAVTSPTADAANNGTRTFILSPGQPINTASRALTSVFEEEAITMPRTAKSNEISAVLILDKVRLMGSTSGIPYTIASI